MVRMKPHPRIYEALFKEHLGSLRQMLLISGPRQVGKTTACRKLCSVYLDWDNLDDRERILAGPAKIVGDFGLNRLEEHKPVILFDELHKYRGWKQFLKGFFDTYSDQIAVMVTGSGRMDVCRRGGDSLMGRYFSYHMHPFTIAEIVVPECLPTSKIIRPPRAISEREFSALYNHGGYPEPFIRNNQRFSRRWQDLRSGQFVREDIRELTQVQHLAQIEMMVRLLRERSAEQIVYSNLAKSVRVAVDTIRSWLDILCNLHFGFLVRPWFRNVSRSLRKEPKWFLRDWAEIEDPGKKAETFVACHLLKAVDTWNDMGLGRFSLGYLRDKSRREVDFAVVRDGKPWFLVEVKHADTSMESALGFFQQQTCAPFAFQVVVDLPFVNANCFARPGGPLVVPARTLLSQLA